MSTDPNQKCENLSQSIFNDCKKASVENSDNVAKESKINLKKLRINNHIKIGLFSENTKFYRNIISTPLIIGILTGFSVGYYLFYQQTKKILKDGEYLINDQILILKKSIKEIRNK